MKLNHHEPAGGAELKLDRPQCFSQQSVLGACCLLRTQQILRARPEHRARSGVSPGVDQSPLCQNATFHDSRRQRNRGTTGSSSSLLLFTAIGYQHQWQHCWQFKYVVWAQSATNLLCLLIVWGCQHMSSWLFGCYKVAHVTTCTDSNLMLCCVCRSQSTTGAAQPRNCSASSESQRVMQMPWGGPTPSYTSMALVGLLLRITRTTKSCYLW